MHRRLATLLVLAVASATALLGLGAAPASAAGSGTAWVRAAHLVPGLGIMTIGLTPFGGPGGTTTGGGAPAAPLQDGMRVIAPSAAYGQAGEYLQVPVGRYTVSIRPVGAAKGSAPLLTGTFDAEADQAYTLAALGSKTSPRIQPLVDDLRPPTRGVAKVRLLPAASGVGAVTVTAAGGPTLAQDALFGRPTGYAEVPAGTWRLTATGVGTATESATVSVAAGDVYTLLVLNAPGGGLTLQPLVDAAGMAAAPVAGVQTGAGGTAGYGAGPALGLLVATAGVLVLVATTRRPTRRPARRPAIERLRSAARTR